MAAITATRVMSGFHVIRQETAQATTGQTDWLLLPQWAQYAMVFLNLSAVAGTTPVLTPAFLMADPVSQDDAHTITVADHAGLTGITAAGQYLYQIGPGVTGIANDVSQTATADSAVSLNQVLPMLLGVRITLDRADIDETYSYNLSLQLKG